MKNFCPYFLTNKKLSVLPFRLSKKKNIKKNVSKVLKSDQADITFISNVLSQVVNVFVQICLVLEIKDIAIENARLRNYA